MGFIPKGIIVPIVTPLTNELKPNEKVLRQLVEFLIRGGVHGVFAVGTTGEFYGFTPKEKQEIFEITLDAAKKRVPVYAGTGGITTRESINLARIAEKCGVDAVSILSPMFISPSQKELIHHYRAIADSTDLPIILYNNLPRTGVNISVDSVEKLADLDNIIGIKDSSGDFTMTSEYIRRTRGKEFHVLAGRDTLIHACLCYGGSGAVASCANIAPRLCADIYDNFVTGDLERSLKAQFAIAPLRIGFKLGTFPAVIKEALRMIGFESGPCLSPVGALQVQEKEKLKAILTGLSLSVSDTTEQPY